MANRHHVDPNLVSSPCVKLQCNQAVLFNAGPTSKLALTFGQTGKVCKGGDLRVCRLAPITDHTMHRVFPFPFFYLDLFVYLCHSGVNLIVNKANIFLDDVMCLPQHLNPIGPSVGLGTKKDATRLRI